MVYCIEHAPDGLDAVVAMREAGHQLNKLQHGLAPDDAKPMPTTGAGVMELRIWDEAGTFRAVYIAKFEDAVYVLHCFKKKTPKTSQPDIELARKRFKELVKEGEGDFKMTDKQRFNSVWDAIEDTPPTCHQYAGPL